MKNIMADIPPQWRQTIRMEAFNGPESVALFRDFWLELLERRRVRLSAGRRQARYVVAYEAARDEIVQFCRVELDRRNGARLGRLMARDGGAL